MTLRGEASCGGSLPLRKMCLWAPTSEAARGGSVERVEKMNRTMMLGAAALVGAMAMACGGKSERVERLQAAFAKSNLTLVESIEVSSPAVPGSSPVAAELNVYKVDPVFEVRANGGGKSDEVTVDPESTEVLSVETLSKQANGPCEGSISVAEAILIAEEKVGGKGALAEIEDCEFEIQVLAGDTLWEVEISKTGKYLEKEEWDEEDEKEDD